MKLLAGMLILLVVAVGLLTYLVQTLIEEIRRLRQRIEALDTRKEFYVDQSYN